MGSPATSMVPVRQRVPRCHFPPEIRCLGTADRPISSRVRDSPNTHGNNRPYRSPIPKLPRPSCRSCLSGAKISVRSRGNGREAAIRRNRTYQKCSSPHGKRPHRLVACKVVDVRERERLSLMLEEDSADSSAGSGSGAGDSPEGGEPAIFGHDNPGKHSLGVAPAQELPRPKLKAEISVGRLRLCCA
jgi:hypothetical protein